MNIDVAKAQSNSNLPKPSAKADGNKIAEGLILLPFTKVNGFVNNDVNGVLIPYQYFFHIDKVPNSIEITTSDFQLRTSNKFLKT